MKSIRELSGQLDCNPLDLNAMFVKNGVYIQTIPGTDDGFIDSELNDYLLDKFEQLKSRVISKELLISIKSPFVPILPGAYIYFLFQSNELIYIGQTVSLLMRLDNHQKTGKSFDEVAVMQVDWKELNMIEAINIIHYSPKLNTSNPMLLTYIQKELRKYI